jgi:hypothetical protein
MGVTISHKLGQEQKYIKDTIKHGKEVASILKKQADAMAIPFEIIQENERSLYINIGGCETLVFNFKTMAEIQKEEAEKGWSYQSAVLKDTFTEAELKDNEEHLKRYPEQRIYWTSDFCKTQYAGSIQEHLFVAEIIRAVASRCRYAIVNDEGDYYYSMQGADAIKAIESNGKIINSMVGMLEKQGWKNDNIVKGGETKIKRTA